MARCRGVQSLASVTDSRRRITAAVSGPCNGRQRAVKCIEQGPPQLRLCDGVDEQRRSFPPKAANPVANSPAATRISYRRMLHTTSGLSPKPRRAVSVETSPFSAASCSTLRTRRPQQQQQGGRVVKQLAATAAAQNRALARVAGPGATAEGGPFAAPPRSTLHRHRRAATVRASCAPRRKHRATPRYGEQLNHSLAPHAVLILVV